MFDGGSSRTDPDAYRPRGRCLHDRDRRERLTVVHPSVEAAASVEGTHGALSDTRTADTRITGGRGVNVLARARGALFGSVLASLLLALVLTTVVLAVTGTNPLDAFGEIWTGATTRNGPRTTLDRATPIIGMALAVALPLRVGTINLGVEGQMVVGGWAAAVIAINLGGPGPS